MIKIKDAFNTIIIPGDEIVEVKTSCNHFTIGVCDLEKIIDNGYNSDKERINNLYGTKNQQGKGKARS